MRAPLDAEMYRILEAVRDGRMLHNEHGRYVIPGEARPNRRARQLLAQRGYIEWRTRLQGNSAYALTELGERAVPKLGMGRHERA